jgi:SAM-dependent MidA family methyltransferase
LSAELAALLRNEIIAAGPISFARFMERALYEPGLGYYARPLSPTGRRGDFITSVSVGACFGQLLAEQIADYWQAIAAPTEFHVVEQGANDGRLMADVLHWLAARHPACHQSVRPHFIEPLATARMAQRALVPNARHHDSAASVRLHPEATVDSAPHQSRDCCGVFFCNELLDAFPVQRIRWNGSSWQELGVGLDAHGAFAETLIGPHLELPIPSSRLPLDYTTELCPTVEPWMESISQLFTQGLWLIMDYGLTAEEYFAPHRMEGTLRGYHQHQMVTRNFLDDPGAMDLTAHVNWTSVVTSAQDYGLEVHGEVNQMRFLTALAEPVLRSMENNGKMSPDDLAWLRQFQTLTNPGQMGVKFQALLLTKGPLEGRLRGAKFAR